MTTMTTNYLSARKVPVFLILVFCLTIYGISARVCLTSHQTSGCSAESVFAFLKKPHIVRVYRTNENVVAATIWLEARGEKEIGMKYVACVIKNRAKLKSKTPEEICLAKWQFSCWNSNPNYVDIKLRSSKDVATWRWLVNDVQESVKADNAAVSLANLTEATHYLNPRRLNKLPSWANTNTYLTSVGNHDFYKTAF
jgi:hypothetical protein